MLIETIFVTILKAALFGGVAGTVLVLICLHWDRIVSFLSANTELKESDVNNIGFSLQEKLSSGDFKTVYGIFNKSSQKVLTAEAVSSQQVDARVSEMHNRNPLVVFN